MSFILLGVIVTTFLQKLFIPSRKPVILGTPSLGAPTFTNHFYGTKFEILENSSGTGRLRGGGSGLHPNCSLEGCTGFQVVTQTGPDGSNEVLSETFSQKKAETSKQKKGLLKKHIEQSDVHAFLTAEEVVEIFKEVLDSPTYSCKNEKGKVINLDYRGGYTLSGPFCRFF